MLAKVRKNVRELFLIYEFKHVFLFLILIIVSNFATAFAYYDKLNFWSILLNSVTNSLHYAILLFLIIFIIIDLSHKMKKNFIILRYKNYEKYLNNNLIKIIFCVLLTLIISLIINIAISCIRSKFDFTIISLDYYDIPVFLYLIIHFFKVLFIIILIAVVIYYLYNLVNNKIILMINFMIPMICLSTNPSIVINDILHIPLFFSFYLIYTPFSNVFLEISGYIIQIFIFSLTIIFLENKIFSRKEDLF